ncbi:MAG: hypothetical protein ACI9VR_001302 [Cognaticolwellia sp.]|jgi:hypothetical protein
MTLILLSTLGCVDLTWPDGTGERTVTEATGETGFEAEAFSECSAEDGNGGVEVQSLSISGDTLSAELGYGGGCEVHLFELCWPSQNFEYTDPPQVTLELWHGGEPDACDLYEIETIEFDLSALKQVWQDESSLESGTLLIQLGGQIATYTF